MGERKIGFGQWEDQQKDEQAKSQEIPPPPAPPAYPQPSREKQIEQRNARALKIVEEEFNKNRSLFPTPEDLARKFDVIIGKLRAEGLENQEIFTSPSKQKYSVPDLFDAMEEANTRFKALVLSTRSELRSGVSREQYKPTLVSNMSYVPRINLLDYTGNLRAIIADTIIHYADDDGIPDRVFQTEAPRDREPEIPEALNGVFGIIRTARSRQEVEDIVRRYNSTSELWQKQQMPGAQIQVEMSRPITMTIGGGEQIIMGYSRNGNSYSLSIYKENPYQEKARMQNKGMKGQLKNLFGGSSKVLLIPMIGFGLVTALSGVRALNDLPFGQVAQRSETRITANRASADDASAIFNSIMNSVYVLCDQTYEETRAYEPDMYQRIQQDGMSVHDIFTDGPIMPYHQATLNQCRSMGWMYNWQY